MARTTCLVSLAGTIGGCHKNLLEEHALVAGTKQNLSNLLFLDIYGHNSHSHPCLLFVNRVRAYQSKSHIQNTSLSS